MKPLNNEQKELLFDYCIGLTSPKENDEVESLISSNQEATEIYEKLRAAITPLESIEPEGCPDELVETTINRVQNLAASGDQLRELLAGEQYKKNFFKFINNIL